MGEIVQGVNWPGVAIGAIAAFALGWLWYSPLMFGKKWAEGVGVELAAASDMPVPAMATQFLGLFLMSWFVGVTAVANHLATAVLATIAFAILFFSAALFTRKDPFVRNVEVGHWIASLVVMIICQAIF
jgi:hypothetical protein